MEKIQVNILEFSKTDLLKIPEDERLFIFLMSQALNEIIILKKLWLVIDRPSNPGIQRSGSNAQSLFIIRTYVHKIYEAWQIIRNCYQGKIHQKYCNELSDRAGSGLDQIIKYFDDKNFKETPIYKIRNGYAGHYGWKEPKTVLDRINIFPETEMLEIFFGNSRANTLYNFSEKINNYALTVIYQQEYVKALEQLLKVEFSELFDNFCDFGHAIIAAIYFKYMPNEYRVDELSDIRKIEDIRVPYFISTSDKVKTRSP